MDQAAGTFPRFPKSKHHQGGRLSRTRVTAHHQMVEGWLWAAQDETVQALAADGEAAALNLLQHKGRSEAEELFL